MLFAIVLGNLVIPFWAARERTFRRGLQKTIVGMVVLDVLFGLLVRYI